MFLTSIKLSIMVLLLVPIMVVPILAMGRRLRKLSRESQSRIADSSGMASEMLLASSTIQAFNYVKNARDNFSDIIDKSFFIAKKRILVRSIITALIIFVVFVGIVAVLWVGARDVRLGIISPGYLVQFVIYSGFVAGAVAALSEIFGELQRAAGATDRIIEILKSQDPVKQLQNIKSIDRKNEILIDFKNVTFSYPSRPNEIVFNDLNFFIGEGNTLALVGPSGAGKSSIFQILLRFYEFTKGSVKIAGLSIKEIDTQTLRDLFAFVPQEPAIFANSVLENIRFGRPDANNKEVEDAAKKSAAHEFIMGLPEGYDTFVGERGVLLSVGEKQRIAIARAFLRNSPILLLDEPTASLDAESEGLIQRALKNLSKSKTVIVIAHRLSTVKKADKILVLEKGNIVSEGTHAELIKKNGTYAKLARLQFLTN